MDAVASPPRSIRAAASAPPCPWHASPDGWHVVCAIISQLQLLTATVAAVWHCLPGAPKASVQPLIRQFFLHLRVVQSTADGEMRVLFTDIAKSFGMGNTGWKVHLEHRFPGARKIRVTGIDQGHCEYVSLSLVDFVQFVLWSIGEDTDNQARDHSRNTTFQKDEPRPAAARAFMQRVCALLSAFGKLPQSPDSDPPSLPAFLLGHQWIRQAAFGKSSLLEVNEDGSAGAPLALTDFQKDLQSKAPEEKNRRRVDKQSKVQLNKERKAAGLSAFRVRKPSVKAVQVGPQIGKKRVGGKQRERAPAVIEAEQQPPQQHYLQMLHDQQLDVSLLRVEDDADDDVANGAEDDEEGNNSEGEGEEEEEEEESHPTVAAAPLSPAIDAQQRQLLLDTEMALADYDPSDWDLPQDLLAPAPTGTFEFHAPMLLPDSWPDLFDPSSAAVDGLLF